MVLSVDDNAHYWQQHPHSSSATSQMSGTRTRAIKTLEMEDLCRIALKKAPLSDVVVQRHSSARCVVAGRHGWARIQTFPKPVVPEPFDSYTRAAKPWNHMEWVHWPQHDLTSARKAVTRSRWPAACAPGSGVRPRGAGCGWTTRGGSRQAEKGIWGRCFHRFRREITRSEICWQR